jgi:hypothetical protein
MGIAYGSISSTRVRTFFCGHYHGLKLLKNDQRPTGRYTEQTTTPGVWEELDARAKTISTSTRCLRLLPCRRQRYQQWRDLVNTDLQMLVYVTSSAERRRSTFFHRFSLVPLTIPNWNTGCSYSITGRGTLDSASAGREDGNEVGQVPFGSIRRYTHSECVSRQR